MQPSPQLQQLLPTLYYFNFRGRGELCRLTLAVTGVDFRDVRFDRREWAETYRDLSPNGRCPFLRLPDGRILSQSLAISRYFARLGGLYGRDSWEAFLVDQAVQQAEDLELELLRIYRTDVEQRLALWESDISARCRELAMGLARLVPDGRRVLGADAPVSLGDLAVFKAADAVARLPVFNLPERQHASLAEAAKELLLLPDLQEHSRKLLDTCQRLAAYASGRPDTP